METVNSPNLKYVVLTATRSCGANAKSANPSLILPIDFPTASDGSEKSFHPVLFLCHGYTRGNLSSPSILIRLLFLLSSILRRAHNRALSASLFPRSCRERRARWKGPEAEGEGEEPVVNQNRRSSESPSHLSETVRGPVCVEIVARRSRR